MKKFTIMMFVVAVAGLAVLNAAEPVLNFNSRGDSLSLPVPEAGAPQIIPGRRSHGPYDFSNVAIMDNALNKTIATAGKTNSPWVLAGLKCLRKNGTPKQKAAFIYAAGAYAFPETCEPGTMAGKRGEGDKEDCVMVMVCQVSTETVLKWTCEADGKCSYQPVEVLYETCDMHCR